MMLQNSSIFTASVVAYLIGTVIYRLYFHPLAKFPGPFWARLTTLPSYWYTLRQDRHIWLWQLQHQYVVSQRINTGPIFRYRPDSVLVNTPSGYKTLFGPAGNVKKGLYYKVWPSNANALSTWNSTDIEIHGRKRRVLNYAFSDKALRSAEPFITSNIDRWCEIIAKGLPEAGWSNSLNMADWVNYLVFDILGDLCFGKSFDMKEQESNTRYVPGLLAEFLKLMHPVGFDFFQTCCQMFVDQRSWAKSFFEIAYSPFAPLWAWLKPRGLDKLISLTPPRAMQDWQKFVHQCLNDRTLLEQRKDDSARRKDFFYYLYNAVDPDAGERGFPLEELFGECESLTIAGSDTTSIVISALFFYLARKPEIQKRLAQEILSTFANTSEIRSGEALQSCTHLHAVIQEALRMTPPVSAEPSREVLDGGTTVDGHFFPGGVNVSTGLYCLSYNEDIFPQPFDFRPERWMVGHSSAEIVALAESGFCAFSHGSRGCPGKNLAWLEMKLVMAKVIFNFEIKPDATNDIGGGCANGKVGRQTVDQYQTYDAFVSLRDGPMVHFKSREK